MLLGIVGKPLIEQDLTKVILKILDLKYGNSFCHWKLNLEKLKKRVLEGNKQLGNQFTLEPMAQATIVCNESTIHPNPKEKKNNGHDAPKLQNPKNQCVLFG